MSTGTLLISLAQVWLYLGAAVALAFLLVGIGRINEDARGSYIFRPLLVPGVLLIWPVVLWRWLSAEMNGLDSIKRDRPLRDAHGYVWIVLAILIPAIFLLSLAIRQTPPKAGSTAIQINPPAQ